MTGLEDTKAEAEIGWVVDLVTAIRSVRAEMNIVPATLTPIVLAGASRADAGASRPVAGIHQAVGAGVRYFVCRPRRRTARCNLSCAARSSRSPLKGVIDLVAERARLEKEMSKVDADIKRVDAKLSNADFVKRAPEEIIDGEREKRDEAEGRRTKILEALERLAGVA